MLKYFSIDDYSSIEIRQIKEQTIGAKGFACLEHNREELCKAVKYSLTNLVECKETDPGKCNYALRIENIDFCKCPLRNYIYSVYRK